MVSQRYSPSLDIATAIDGVRAESKIGYGETLKKVVRASESIMCLTVTLIWFLNLSGSLERTSAHTYWLSPQNLSYGSGSQTGLAELLLA